MDDKAVELVIGSLLHDIGKVIYRSGDGRNHSISGYDFLKEDVKIDDKEILDAVKYHHGKQLLHANILENSNAYIVYIADNIASANDRRENMENDYGFEPSIPLSSVFNILNQNNQNLTYAPEMLKVEKGINYPDENKTKFSEGFYAEVVQMIKSNLHGLNLNSEYINSLLEVLEATCIYIPSSTNKGELADISLYDHVKMTAAVASCIMQYLNEKNYRDYKKILFENAKDFYDEAAFCLYSMDISGIQDFIYTISSQNALKTLRSRSFYLEIMMEHIIDELLEKLQLSRANLLYVGGGHCYLLLPNTEEGKKCIAEYEKEVNQWLKDTFDTALYIGGAACECSANQLKNVPKGAYADLYRTISRKISDKKLCRYDANDIIAFNNRKSDSYERECRVCKRIGKVNEEGECTVCSAIKSLSRNILKSKFFIVSLKQEKDALALPGGKYLTACDDERKVAEKAENDNYFVRMYGINKMYTGKHLATKLWVGNYTKGSTFDELADSAEGIDRIAVFRADVDNLGTTFVSGFKQLDGKYETLSRTATLSRQLSLFFKQHINYILEHPSYSLTGKTPERNITIVYSGGDDIFIVGAWNDVLEFAIDLRDAFSRFTQNTLTISGGIGIYKSGYPISVMAQEVEKLENIAKQDKSVWNMHMQEKNAITLFQEETFQDEIQRLVFKWEQLKENVLGEKYKFIKDFFDANDGYGKNFLYNLLDLIHNRKDKINFARYVYLLSRMEPDRNKDKKAYDMYKVFAEKMYNWMKAEDEQTIKELIAAIYIYIYLNRDEKEESENENY